MDALAKAHWHQLQTNRPAPFSLPAATGTWSLWIHGQRVTKWDSKTADQLFYDVTTSIYWGQKYEQFPDMDYQSICMAYKSLSLFYQLRVPKWIGRRLPVGSRTALWAPNNLSNCPRCGTDSESHIHVVACQHPGAVALVTAWLDKLELWLVKQHTHPDVRFGIVSLLRAGFRAMDWVPPHTSDPNIRTTFRKQQGQGSSKVMFGWWATGWAEVQNSYLVSLSKRTSGRRWLSRLIKKQWEIAWDLWRHRMEVSATPDSFSVAIANDQVNAEIRVLYNRLCQSVYPPLRRWFRQPLPSLLQQPLAFKHDWLFMVRSFDDA
jgi:hypothetical protein